MVIHAFIPPLPAPSLFLDRLKKTKVIYNYRFSLEVICLFPLLVSTTLTCTAHLVNSQLDGPFHLWEAKQLLKRRPKKFYLGKNIKLIV